MTRKRLPKTAGATVQLSVRLTRSQKADLDRYCAESKLTRTQVSRDALEDYRAQLASSS
jgi:hypothetical protein